MENNSRRNFIRNAAITSIAGVTVPSFLQKAKAEEVIGKLKSFNHASPMEAAMDEEYWRTIRMAYSVSPSIINLNNGGCSPSPIIVQDMLDKYNRLACETPTYYMWRILDMGREPLRENLASLAGVSPEEIAINRNASEALETIIFGINLEAGDEVILCRQDYPNMMNAWKLREKRHGIKLVWLDLILPSEDDNYFTKIYADAVTPKTKVVHLTHTINWCGQFIPVRKITDAVRAKNAAVEFVCDSAHSFCHIDFKIPDLGVDYWGTALHKWLCAPIGSGMLWVKKEKIKNLWPLFANDKPDSEDIRKFESLGTRSFPIEQAIGYAIEFHNSIGMAKKEARLRYLKNYWCEKVKDIPKVKLYTSLKPEYGCGIGTFYIEGMELKDIDATLFNKYKIHTTSIEYEHFKHIRVTPNVYTQLYELDKFVKAITEMATATVTPVK